VSTLLRIDSSPLREREQSISRTLTEQFARHWRGAVVYRDLAATAMPMIDAAWIAASYTPKRDRTPAQHAMLACSDELVAELLAADDYVLGVPIHNWSTTASLKLWADQIVQFGVTVAATPGGLRGLLVGKRLTAFVTAGRHLESNLVAPWLNQFFGQLGVDPIRIVVADGTADVKHRKIDRGGFLAPHVATIDSWFA
jgi:FMN-dependent NADH-azoreductase